jgi:hypothetical protein
MRKRAKPCRLAWNGVCLGLILAGILPAGTAAWAYQATQAIKGWGEVINPAGDCTIELQEGGLVIQVPAAPHDLTPELRMNAPRVLRDIEGNFQAVVKVAGFPAASEGESEGSQGAGFLLWEDDRNHLRFERELRRDAGGAVVPGAVFEYRKDRQPNRQALEGAEFGVSGPDCWLRLTRRGSKLTAEVSGDGTSWKLVKATDVRLSSRIRIGMVARNTTKTPLKVRFEGFQTKGISLSG